MITWNLDPTLYTKEQLENLLYAVEQMDCSISKQIEEYIVETFEQISESSVEKISEGPFRVKYKSKEEFFTLLSLFKIIGALGTTIGVSTCFDDYELVEEIFSETSNSTITFDGEDGEDEDICEFSVCVEDRPNILTEYASNFGINGISVALSTKYDVRVGDVFSRIVEYDKVGEETLKLMNKK